LESQKGVTSSANGLELGPPVEDFLPIPTYLFLIAEGRPKKRNDEGHGL
jgi:hypothetical protein